MKHLCILFLSLLFLAACQAAPAVTTLEDPSPDQSVQSSQDGLTLLLTQESYKQSPTIIKTSLINESFQSFEYGDYYYIELKKDGKWFLLKHSDSVFIENPQFLDYGKVLLPHTQVTQEFSIDLLDLNLVSGHYRLVKTFLSQELPYREISLAVQFTVE